MSRSFQERATACTKVLWWKLEWCVGRALSLLKRKRSVAGSAVRKMEEWDEN